MGGRARGQTRPGRATTLGRPRRHSRTTAQQLDAATTWLVGIPMWTSVTSTLVAPDWLGNALRRASSAVTPG